MRSAVEQGRPPTMSDDQNKTPDQLRAEAREYERLAQVNKPFSPSASRAASCLADMRYKDAIRAERGPVTRAFDWLFGN
jgi:hypothetical protein